MGQRHQVYIIGKLDTLDRVGFHNQWSYGTLPLRALTRILKYQKKADKYSILTYERLTEEKSIRKIQALLSCDYNEGFFSDYWDITSEGCTNNPNKGDNNDGITIIDLRTDKPKYAFMFLESSDYKETKGYIAYTAEEYLNVYYKPTDTDKKSIDCRKDAQKFLKFLSKYQVLSTEEIKNIFPEMI